MEIMWAKYDSGQPTEELCRPCQIVKEMIQFVFSPAHTKAS
jgi:hypothetical protein